MHSNLDFWPLKTNDESIMSIHCPSCGDNLNNMTWLTPEGNPLVLSSPATDTDKRIAQALERIATALERMHRGQ